MFKVLLLHKSTSLQMNLSSFCKIMKTYQGNENNFIKFFRFTK